MSNIKENKLTYLLIALSVIYLLFELSFNATIIGAVSKTNLSQDYLHQLETVGRILSAIAITLAVLPFLLKKFDGNYFMLSAKLLGVAVIAFVMIKVSIDHIIASVDDAYRKNAMTAVMVKDALIKERLVFTDDKINLSNTDTKVFIALLPWLSLEKADGTFESHTKILRDKLLKDDLNTTPAQAYKSYQDLMNLVKLEYKDYLDAQNPKSGFVAKNLSQLKESQEKLKNGYELSEHFGKKVIPLALKIEDFYQHEAVQQTIKEKLDVSFFVERDLSAYDFEQKVFNVKFNLNENVVRFSESVETFAKGAKNYDHAQKAVEVVMIPPIALLFSFFGIVLHFSKLSFLLSKVVCATALVRYGAPFGLMVLFVIGALINASLIAKNQLILEFLKQDDTYLGALIVGGQGLISSLSFAVARVF